MEGKELEAFHRPQRPASTSPHVEKRTAMADSAHGFEILPGTDQIAPAVMTAEEACCYLRLDVLKNPIKALNVLVDRKLLRPCMYKKERHYTRDELDRFLTEQTEVYGDVA